MTSPKRMRAVGVQRVALDVLVLRASTAAKAPDQGVGHDGRTRGRHSCRTPATGLWWAPGSGGMTVGFDLPDRFVPCPEWRGADLEPAGWPNLLGSRAEKLSMERSMGLVSERAEPGCSGRRGMAVRVFLRRSYGAGRRSVSHARRAQADRRRVARCCATPIVWVESSRSTACRPAERVPGERAEVVGVRADVRVRKEYPHRCRASHPTCVLTRIRGCCRAAGRRHGAGGPLRARYLRERPVLILNGTFCSRRPGHMSTSMVTAGPAPLMR